MVRVVQERVRPLPPGTSHGGTLKTQAAIGRGRETQILILAAPLYYVKLIALKSWDVIQGAAVCGLPMDYFNLQRRFGAG